MNLKIAISFGTPRASFDVIEATIIEKYFSDTDRGGASSRDVARLCDIIAPRMPYTWEMYFSKKKKKNYYPTVHDCALLDQSMPRNLHAD